MGAKRNIHHARYDMIRATVVVLSIISYLAVFFLAGCRHFLLGSNKGNSVHLSEGTGEEQRRRRSGTRY